MKINDTSCQAIHHDEVYNVCPFCVSLRRGGVGCKLGADLSYYSCVVINFIPNDCPIRKPRTYVALLDEPKTPKSK
jgi:hypothetical protein